MKTYIIIILILLGITIIINASQSEEQEYEFTCQDSVYTFSFNFVVKAEADSLLNLIYDFSKITEYSQGVKSLEMVRQSENWYEVAFLYQNLLILENRSLWRRSIDRENNIITFEMLINKNNISFIPELQSSHGYYQISTEDDSCRIELFQECCLKPGILKSFYLKKAEKEAVKFMHVFKGFIAKNCE